MQRTVAALVVAATRNPRTRIVSTLLLLAALWAPGLLLTSTATATTVGPANSTAGTPMAWGSNYYGQLGNGDNNCPLTGSSADCYTLTPAQVGSLSNIIAVAGGGAHSMALTADGAVYAWGDNGYGELGNGTTSSSPAPVQVSGLSNVVAIAVGDSDGYGASLALDANGTVWAWGDNTAGELGDGASCNAVTGADCNVTTPQQVNVPTSHRKIVAIASGGEHNLALTDSGSVWAWGFNGSGEAGNGGSSSGGCSCNPSPVLISSLSNVSAIAAGHGFSVALASKVVWAWGSNVDGQLGVTTPDTCGGNPCPSLTPVRVGIPSSIQVAAISAGHDFALAVDVLGQGWSWGDNTYGQLGTGNTGGGSSTTPLRVSGLTDVTQIEAGDYHSLALRSDGTVMAWGDNSFSELGTTTSQFCSGTPCSAAPVKAKGLTNVVAIGAGGSGLMGGDSSLAVVGPNPIATFTPGPPTAPPTNTPSNTPTRTPVPPHTPTDTPTRTPIPPTNTPIDTHTPTDTAIPTGIPTRTPTDTPTATHTPTDTRVPPTAPPTRTPTDAPVPPTNTPTHTQAAPTATNTPFVAPPPSPTTHASSPPPPSNTSAPPPPANTPVPAAPTTPPQQHSGPPPTSGAGPGSSATQTPTPQSGQTFGPSACSSSPSLKLTVASPSVTDGSAATLTISTDPGTQLSGYLKNGHNVIARIEGTADSHGHLKAQELVNIHASNPTQVSFIVTAFNGCGSAVSRSAKVTVVPAGWNPRAPHPTHPTRHGNSNPAHQVDNSLLFGLGLTPGGVANGGKLTVTMHAAPRTPVLVLARVLPYSTIQGNATGTNGGALYQKVLQGATDAHGQYSGRLQLSYRNQRGAVLLVSMREGKGSGARTARVTILPARYHPGRTLLISVGVKPGSGKVNDNLSVAVQSVPHVHVAALVRALLTKTTTVGKGKQATQKLQTSVLYQKVLQGSTNGRGQYAAGTNLSYKPAASKPTIFAVAVL